MFDVPTIAFWDFEHGLDIVSARKKWNRTVSTLWSKTIIQFENQKMLDKVTKHSQKVCQVFDVPTIAFWDFEHGLDIIITRKNPKEMEQK